MSFLNFDFKGHRTKRPMAGFEHSEALRGESRSSTCDVCGKPWQDPRLLHCLHSFCRMCIDVLAFVDTSKKVREDSSGGSRSTDGESEGESEDKSKNASGGGRRVRAVRCPLKQCGHLTSPMPLMGAASLARDVTKWTDNEQEDVEVTDDETKSEDSGHWTLLLQCLQCRAMFCSKEQAFAHVTKLSGHNISAAPGSRNMLLNGSDKTTPPLPRCSDHKEPIVVFCKACSVPACTVCITDGKHAAHAPFVLLDEFVAEQKSRVLQKAERVERELLPQLEAALEVLDRNIEELERNKSSVKFSIDSALQRAKEKVKECLDRRLHQLDEIVMTRTRNLNQQCSELNNLVHRIKAVISFTESLKTTKISMDDMNILLSAVEKRLDSLHLDTVSLEPVEHSLLEHDDQDYFLENGVGNLLGRLLLFEASSLHSCFVQTPWAAKLNVISKGGIAALVLQAKTNTSRELKNGGDWIATEWIHGPRTPPVGVFDFDNGRYLLTAALHEEGEYTLAVIVNGFQIPQTIALRCAGDPIVSLDPLYGEEGIMIDDDRRFATLTEEKKFGSVCGLQGAEIGQLDWKVQVGRLPGEKESTNWAIGIVSKTGSTNTKRALCWSGRRGEKMAYGRPVGLVGDVWKPGDVIDCHLDCDTSTLRMINLRSGSMAIFEGLRREEWFAIFVLDGEGSTVTLVE